MTTSNDVGGRLREFAASWPVIAAAVVVTLVAGAAYGVLTQPEPGWDATAHVRVVTVPNLLGAPSPESVTASALRGDVQQAAAEQLGIEPGDIRDRVSASVDTRDKQVTRIVVHGPDQAEALAWADAIAAAASADANAAIARYAETQESLRDNALLRLTEYEESKAELVEDLAEPGLSRSDVAAIETLIQGYEFQIAHQAERLQTWEQNSGIYSESASVLGDATAVESESTGYVVSSALKGGIVGLLAGILIVLALDRLRRPGQA